MKKRRIPIFSLLALFLFFTVSSSTNAQVTVGSEIGPSKGALLDLKEYESSNTVTSKKGLTMPRVHLKDLTKLYPMFENDNDYINNTGGKQDTENALHIGLAVYNINTNFCDKPYYDDGIYVWNGKKWDYLGNSGSSEVMTFSDQDGNPFKARRFGNAGIWMLQNVRATTYANGSPAPQLNAGSSATDKYYCYPAPLSNPEGIQDGTLDKYFLLQPEMGLLYNPAAALNLENTSTANQEQVAGDIPGPNEVENTAPNGRIQGICPKGWHVPSDREWNQLEREIYDSPQKYSTYTDQDAQLWNPIPWNRNWETQISGSSILRGSSTGEGHGRAMLTSCPLVASVYQGNFTGKSLPSYLGGFDVLPVGTAYNGQLSLGVEEYGYVGYFLTSSRTWSGVMTWFRGFGMDQSTYKQYVIRNRLLPGGPESLLSVRCKKDE